MKKFIWIVMLFVCFDLGSGFRRCTQDDTPGEPSTSIDLGSGNTYNT